MEKRYFPDGTEIDHWFFETDMPKLGDLGRPYVLTDYGVCDDGTLQTEKIQALIDKIAEEGGGVVVVPAGTYRTGTVRFKQGVNLYVSEGGVLMGSDDPADYSLGTTRIEGETCTYYGALIEADGVDGFTMCGPGTVDGNGARAWRSFWLRYKWNPKCTNKDEQRPRLVFISNSQNVTVAGLHLQNSHFWTNHIYKCNHVKFLGCDIRSSIELRAPSTDAIDIDACTDVLVKNCYMEVNDDGVVLKGGKGPWADTDPNNGSNERILVEDCTYGRCHGCLTCGSEAIHNRNILLRRVKVEGVMNLCWLKMRPDTPQRYEYITMEEITGTVRFFININPWTQFFDLKGRTDKPISVSDHITMKNCDVQCEVFFRVSANEEQYHLQNFTFENLNIRAWENNYRDGVVENMQMINVQITKPNK